MCAARAASGGCAICGEPVRAGALRCAAHSSASLRGQRDRDGFLEVTAGGALATTARIDPGEAVPGPGAFGSHPLRRAGRAVRTPLLVVAAIVGFNLVFPILVANQRPTVLTQSGAISAGVAAAEPRVPVASVVPAWDPVDVELFVGSCTQSEPPVVCQCQAQALQPFYSGEQALAYADQQASKGRRAALPQHYKDVLVRCSEGY